MAETALIVIEKLDPAKIFSGDGMQPILDEIKKKVEAHVPDSKTDGGRKDIIALAYKVSRSKTLLDDAGKAFTAEAKKKYDAGNAARKTARTFLDTLRDETRQPVTDWEAEEAKKQEEADRQDRIKTQIRVDSLQGWDVVESFAKVDLMSDDEFDGLEARSRLAWQREQDRRADETAAQEAETKRLEEQKRQQAQTTRRFEQVEAEQAEARAKIAADQKAAQAKIEADKKAVKASNKKRSKNRFQTLKDINYIYAGDVDLGVMSELDYLSLFQKAMQRKVDADKKAADDARIKAEQDAKDEADRKVKEAAEKVERDALAAMERKRVEFAMLEREKALLPDKAKLTGWIDDILSVVSTRPDIQDDELSGHLDDAVYVINRSIGDLQGEIG